MDPKRASPHPPLTTRLSQKTRSVLLYKNTRGNKPFDTISLPAESRTLNPWIIAYAVSYKSSAPPHCCRTIPSRCCSYPFPPSQNSEPSVLVCEKEAPLPLHPPEVRSSLHTNTLVDYPISTRYTASVWSRFIRWYEMVGWRSWNLEPCIVHCVRELEVSPTALHPDQEFVILVPTNHRPIPHGSGKMSGTNSVTPCWSSHYAPPSDPKGPSL